MNVSSSAASMLKAATPPTAAKSGPAQQVNDHDADDMPQAAAPKAMLSSGQGQVVDITA
jgi:hypothetical protein